MKKSCKGLPGCKESSPGILTKAKNLVKDTVRHVSSGAENLSDKDYLIRINECKKCDYFNEKKSVCELCGCYMIVKARWKTSTCPKNKWRI